MRGEKGKSTLYPKAKLCLVQLDHNKKEKEKKNYLNIILK